MRVGILGSGLFLPPSIRTNSWWPAATVAHWMQERGAPPPLEIASTPGVERVRVAMATQTRDPFQGAVERRVLDPEAGHLDMEVHAARIAIERAKIDPRSIDLVLVETLAPDFLGSNLACVLHERLGLQPACLALQVDAAQYTYVGQLALAEAMIVSGRARVALLVQSSVGSRLIDPQDPISPLFGDGAAAMVLGEVDAEHGLLSFAHLVDGRFSRTMIAGIPTGQPWYEQGRSHVHLRDPLAMYELMLRTADSCKEGIDAALAKIGKTASDIDFLCIHQGTPWLREVVQAYAGVAHARTVDTFSRTAHLHGALLPSNLILAEADGQLHPGDLVVVVGGGTGMIYGAAVMRWGPG